MNKKKIVFILAILSFVFSWHVLGNAAQQSESPSEAIVRDIAKSLRCAVCQNQSIYESNSDLAKDMLQVIRMKVAGGEKEAAIRDYFFQRYGDYIYLEPTAQGGNWLLWVGPFIALLLGAVALIAALKKWHHSNPAKPKQTPGDQSTITAFQDRLKSELEKVDL